MRLYHVDSIVDYEYNKDKRNVKEIIKFFL